MSQGSTPASESGTEPVQDAPPRTIGTLGASSIVLGSMLGVGIFLNPRLVADASGSTWTFLLYWLSGGIVALAGALSFSELGSMFPRSGGEYVFLRQAFGRGIATAAGWTMVLIIFPGSVAAMCVAVVEYEVVPLLHGWFSVELSAAQSNGLAVGIAVFFAFMNALGAQISARTQAVLVLTPLLLFCALSIVGLSGPAALDAAAAPVAPPPLGGFGGFATAFLAVYFAYSGWNGVAYVAGEVKRPGHTLPRALIGGTALVTLVYVVLGAFFVHSLGLGALRETFEAGTTSAMAVLGERAQLPMLALIGVAVLSSINATVLAGARVNYAVASDRLLPEFFAKLSPTTGVPIRSMGLQLAVATLLIVTGTFDQLLKLTSLTMLLIGFAAVASLFVLRLRLPDAERTFRVPLFPLTPLVFLVSTGAVIAFVTWNAMSEVLSTDQADGESLYLLIGLGLFAGVALAQSLFFGRKTA